MLENISISQAKREFCLEEQNMENMEKMSMMQKKLNQADKNKSVRILQNGNGKIAKSGWKQLC